MELAALVALTLLLGALILLVAVAVRKQKVETDEAEQTAEPVGKNSASSKGLAVPLSINNETAYIRASV